VGRALSGVEDMHVASWLCPSTGPAKGQHAKFGISLPGPGERSVAPVYVDGVKPLR